MPRTSEPFRPSKGRRQILIAEDELINREILAMMLEDGYDLLFAADGRETMEMIREHRETLSLVLLDILMPEMSGLDVLRALREDERLSRIPVIVMTAEREAEIESLELGAVDFIPKPYPEAGVVRARVGRTIELFEDQETIRLTERDELTGLYSRKYFYRYAEQMDQYGGEAEMDAVVLDVNHFHLINERYGRHYGDTVLRRIGTQLREIAEESGGIACRTEADTFLAYCPCREDYQQLLESVSAHMLDDDDFAENRVRLRMGVYMHTDRSIGVEERFDRAKMAADTVKGSFQKNIGYYDDSLYRQELYAEQLIEDFPAAVAEGQFRVFYQPKFDVRPDTPVLTSAEALVRWVHPKLGMISPGTFIPLFEENGLIQQLDAYVWRETARQIRDWKDRLGYSIPVSVNVSRIDLDDPGLPEKFRELLSEYGLSGEDLLLEITESAYTRESGQIIEMVNTLRGMGLRIEMDDFGTGYSSLNMISRLPIDALKMDMQFIRSAFQKGGTTRMLEVIIGIADFLSVPVIAEGVETEEQLHALRRLGCEIVQGYFFSRPVEASEFEPFILQRKEADLAAHAHGEEDAPEDAEEAHALPEEPAPEPAAAHREIRLGKMSIFLAILALIAAVALLVADVAVTRGYQRMERASDRYILAQSAASELESASDYLTDRVRCFVVTGNAAYMEDFFEEVEVTRRRDRAVDDLENLLEGAGGGALDNLNAALNLSNELVELENTAMRLTVEAGDYPLSEVPETLRDISLSPELSALSPEEKREAAETLMFDENYMHYKDRIRENVRLCTQELIRSSGLELEQSSNRLQRLVAVHSVLTILLLAAVLAAVGMILQLVLRPLATMVRRMQGGELIEPSGAEELRFVARTYNRITLENRKAQERLSHAASHDALTGLFNRGAYDLLMEDADKEHMALILIDVDRFKTINDTYGHAVGDKVLKRVADILRKSFRSVDILCRTGGDEFAVIMTRVNSSMRQLVIDKINRANEMLQHPEDDLPPVSLSAGAAFSDRKNPQGDLFTDADTALYRVKKAGRRGCGIYE